MIELTNELHRSAAHLIDRNANGMPIENCMASSLYRLFAERLGNGYATGRSEHIFRDFINAVAHVMIDELQITMRF